MAIVSTRVTVAATPTIVVDTFRGGNSFRDNTSSSVKNTGGASVYLGGAAVAAADGFELAPGQVITIDHVAGDDLYGITAAGTVVVHVMRLKQ